MPKKLTILQTSHLKSMYLRYVNEILVFES